VNSGQYSRRDFLRRTLASSAITLGFQGSLRGNPSADSETFAEIRGTDRVRELLEDAFSIYAGRPDGNTLAKMVILNARGTRSFVNDNVWWKYTDFQCNYHATYGWRPFFNKAYREIDRETWQAPFRFQVTKTLQDYVKTAEQAPNAPPLNWLPYSFDPLGKIPYPFDAATEHPSVYSATWFYSNIPFDSHSRKIKPGIAAEFAENTDYPLMNCITATDHLLWERDVAQANVYLPKIDAFLEALRQHCQDSSGLLRVGTQGSQIEFCHYGFRYPGHTHIYLLKVYRNMRQVALMAGRNDLADKYGESSEQLEQKIPRFIEAGKWFVGGLKDAAGKERLGTGRLDSSPSSYFDVWHNVNAAVLHIADDELSRSIVEKIASIPALTANHLTLVNYPARPREEIVPNARGFPQPGVHVNAGWMWMCAAGALYAYTRARRTDLLDRLAELLSDHHQHYSIDYYNQYGANKGSQWPERGHDSYSVTCAGSFGMMFRALLGLQVTASSLEISPTLPQEVERLTTKSPVLYGGKEILFSIHNGEGAIQSVRLNGKAFRQNSQGGVTVPYEALAAKNLVEIGMHA
jgi:hypothetical protein